MISFGAAAFSGAVACKIMAESEASSGSGSKMEANEVKDEDCSSSSSGSPEISEVTEDESNKLTLSYMTLNDEPWFHADIPMTEVRELLKNDGDWLVRSNTNLLDKDGCDDARMDSNILSVRWQNRICHILFYKLDDGVQLLDKTFDTVAEAVNYYYTANISLHPDITTTLHLKTPIVKFECPTSESLPEWVLAPQKVTKDSRIYESSDGFTQVYKGTFLLENYESVPVALKQFGELSLCDRHDFIAEVGKMTVLEHKNIVKILGVVAHEHPYLLVSEFCPHGSLVEYLNNNRGKVKSREKFRFILEAARGMEYLMVSNFPHGDLEAKNALMGHNRTVKLSGFDNCMVERVISEHRYFHRVVREETLLWKAPELLDVKSIMNCTFASDVWSFGILTWEVYSEAMRPWHEFEKTTALTMIKSGRTLSTPAAMPHSVEEIMRKCWKMNPAHRPSIADIRRSLEAFLAAEQYIVPKMEL